MENNFSVSWPNHLQTVIIAGAIGLVSLIFVVALSAITVIPDFLQTAKTHEQQKNREAQQAAAIGSKKPVTEKNNQEKTVIDELNLARKLYKEQKYDEMIAPAQRALAKAVENRDKAEAHNWLSYSYYYTNKLGQAEEQAKLAIEFNPKFSDPYVTLSMVYSQQKKSEQQIAAAQKGVELDPNYSWAHNALGIAYAESGQNDKALVEFTEAARLEPGNLTFSKNIEILKEEGSR